jgi:hypothetical protein
MDITIWIGLGLVALVGLGAVFLFLRSRAPKEEPILHFNCPGCGRKLRYKARQAGHSGKCPRCERPLIFPGEAKKARK